MTRVRSMCLKNCVPKPTPWLARQLRAMGVDEALRARGAKDGDIVRIGNFEFEFVE